MRAAFALANEAEAGQDAAQAEGQAQYGQGASGSARATPPAAVPTCPPLFQQNNQQFSVDVSQPVQAIRCPMCSWDVRGIVRVSLCSCETMTLTMAVRSPSSPFDRSTATVRSVRPSSAIVADCNNYWNMPWF